MRRRQHRSTRDGNGCGDPTESSGRGMQEEIRRGTQEAQRLLIRGKQMKPTELGHVRAKSLDTVWARDEPGHRERSGRFARANAEGCLMGHSSQRSGKPGTWRRIPREYVVPKGNSCRTLSGWIT